MKKIPFYITLIYFLIFLQGCSSMDRQAYTNFEPYSVPNNVKYFKYFSKSDIVYPADTKEGELVRMKWLGMWLEDNNYCPGGYEILERKEVSTGGWKAAANIYYTGKCK